MNMKTTLLFSFMLMTSLLFMVSSGLVNAAVVSGSIYDLALQKEFDVVIAIDTVPKQLLVSKGGDYAFNVNPGSYNIFAYTSTSQAIESITVIDEGEYTLDIILEDVPIEALPDYLSEDFGLDVSLDDPYSKEKSIRWLFILIAVFVLFVTSILLYLFYNHRKHKNIFPEPKDFKNKSLDEHEKLVLGIVQKEKRTTQKELRRHIPLSEAKVSLIISDLEDKGNIRKIKKGRGNVLIFVKE
ncbi:MAG: helix-turn-helix transcriptional regulator [Candidatus Woesearchaeota archaeon]